jgi:hypothetical protein
VAASGTAVIDFGAWPGSSHAAVAVTGQTGIVAGSLVEAWIRPADTADHRAMEHMVETLRVFAADIVAGVGFTIHGFDASERGGAQGRPHSTSFRTATATVYGDQRPSVRDKRSTIYGLWNVAWVWS